MMGKYLFPLLELFYFLFYHNSINSQTYKVTGRVLTDSHYVSHAAVVLYNSLTNSVVDSVITDSLGYYQLNAIVGVEKDEPKLPTNFELAQNYPNPFSNQTEILYKLNKQNEVTIKIYDILGREIKTFRQGEQNIGIHGVRWNGINNHGIKAVPGIYFYQLITNKEIQTMKMVYSPNGDLFAKSGNRFVTSNNKFRLADKTNSVWNRYTFEIKSIGSTKPKIATQRYNDIEIQSDTTIDFVVEPINYFSTVGIYFLKDTTKKISDIMNVDISTLELQEEPWLSGYDIEFYDWSSHCIYLKEDKSYFFPEYQNPYTIPQSWTDRPWIAVANKVRCYIGYFGTVSSANFFPFPEIGLIEVGLYPSDIITSAWPFWFFHPDPRDNETIKDAIIESGLFHSGIEVSFDTLTSPIKVFNDDTTTVEYSLVIKNNDSDDIFVFDPDKVENEIYHFYNNGPNLYNINTDESYGSQYKVTKKPTEWNPDWYILLKSGESIKRIIKLKGYPFIPPGTYLVESEYSLPKQGLEKNIRENQWGRYWVGKARTNTIRITINIE